MTGKNGCARRARKGAVQIVYIPMITLELLFGTLISKAYLIQAKFTPKPAGLSVRLGRIFFPQ